MIQIDNVSKRYSLRKALDNCTVTINKGKIIGIIGENGSGKTTLVKILAGLMKPSKGVVRIDEKLVNRHIGERVAFLSDREYFYDYFSIEQVIHFYGTQFPDFNREKAIEMLSLMKIDQTRKISHLSKGNKTRIKIIVTLAREVPYIIVDEPFSGLDPLVRKTIVNGMLQFVDLDKQTLIMTTHELAEVEAILDEVLLMKQGKIIAYEAVEKIREQENMDVFGWMESHYSSC